MKNYILLDAKAVELQKLLDLGGHRRGEAELTLVGAAEVLGLSYRQTKRVWRRYRLAGDTGLGPRLRGASRRSNGRGYWRGLRSGIRTLGRRWRRRIWRRKAWRWITRRCAVVGSAIGNGASASPAWKRWCNETGPWRATGSGSNWTGNTRPEWQ